MIKYNQGQEEEDHNWKPLWHKLRKRKVKIQQGKDKLILGYK